LSIEREAASPRGTSCWHAAQPLSENLVSECECSRMSLLGQNAKGSLRANLVRSSVNFGHCRWALVPLLDAGIAKRRPAPTGFVDQQQWSTAWGASAAGGEPSHDVRIAGDVLCLATALVALHLSDVQVPPVIPSLPRNQRLPVSTARRRPQLAAARAVWLTRFVRGLCEAQSHLSAAYLRCASSPKRCPARPLQYVAGQYSGSHQI
jgi:hypothetical protein